MAFFDLFREGLMQRVSSLITDVLVNDYGKER